MMYRSDGTAAFVGLERITGRIADSKALVSSDWRLEDGQAKESYPSSPARGRATSAVSAARAPPLSIIRPIIEVNYELD